MRAFTNATSLSESGLSLALAPGLGLDGAQENPLFFQGFTTQPQVVARGLVTLAEITATRYYNYTPQSQRDPILSAHGDRLRAECFSACNGVYACFEVFDSALDGGEISFGTTNVDISSETRALLGKVSAQETLHLKVGGHGLTTTTKTHETVERPVQMPSRWLNALGNISQILPGFELAFQVSASGAKAFLASLPPASATNRTVWLSPQGESIKQSARKLPGAVEFSGIQRLSALKRLLPHAQGMRIFKPIEVETGVLVSVGLPGARMTVALSEEAWRGFSGEGSLLVNLASDSVVADAQLVSALLAFDARIDMGMLVADTGLNLSRVVSALALLAGSGRVGWDPHERVYFHRELPDDHELVLRANPRLLAAYKIFEGGQVHSHGGDWLVKSGGSDYFVRLGNDTDQCGATAVCNCYWYVSHSGSRGPCKHILAAMLKAGVLK